VTLPRIHHEGTKDTKGTKPSPSTHKNFVVMPSRRSRKAMLPID
jgi:hypothetical protein